jgi:hypothetical protein
LRFVFFETGATKFLEKNFFVEIGSAQLISTGHRVLVGHGPPAKWPSPRVGTLGHPSLPARDRPLSCPRSPTGRRPRTSATPSLAPPAVSPRRSPFPCWRPQALTAPHVHRLPYPLLKRQKKANTTSLLPPPSCPAFSLRMPELLTRLCSVLPPGAELPS